MVRPAAYSGYPLPRATAGRTVAEAPSDPKDAAIRPRESQRLDPPSDLNALVDRIQRARGVDQVFRDSVDGMRAVLAADYCALRTQDESGKTRVRAWAGEPAVLRGIVDGLPPWPQDEGDARPVVVSLHEVGPASTLVRVPLLYRRRVVGELVLGRTDGALSENEIRLAEVIAGHVAFSIWRIRSDTDRAELLRRFEAERSVLESVVNQMPEGVLLADVPSGRIITSNPQIAAIWGRTLRHTARISDYAMWGGVDDHGQPLDPTAWPLARSVRDGSTIRDEEITIERSDGSRRIVRMSSAAVKDSEGRQLGAVATVVDVTGERERERREEDLGRAARRMSASLDLDITLDAVVKAVVGPFADWAVLYRADAGDVHAVAATHRDATRAEALRAALVDAGDPGEAHPVRRVLQDRAPMLLQDPAKPPATGAGDGDPGLGPVADRIGCEAVLILPLDCRDRDIGVLVLARHRGRYAASDVQPLIELAQRAALAIDNAALYQRARAADRAKANFLAVMSHEFRTPLSAILGYADILMARVHGELNVKQRAHVNRVKASVRHLTFLVDEILSFASMEAGRERVILRRTGLAELVADSASLMEPMAEAAGLTLTVTVPEEPIMIATDAAKVRQIMINLLSNALKFTEQGEVQVTVDVADEVVHCQVADTGPGIAPEHAEHVFEPFWQVERSGPGGTGTGLGLAVARRLARLMGGDVTLSSSVGEGSRFTLTLPRTHPDPEPGRE